MEATQKSFLSKYWSHILLFIMCVIVLFQCNSGQEAQLANVSLKKEVKGHEQNAEHYLLLARSLNLDVPKYKDSIAKLKFANSLKNEEIANLQKSTKTKSEQVRNYNSIDIQSYIKDRYAITVPLVPQGAIFNDTLSRMVITDLVIGDGAKAELKLTKEVLNTELDISAKKDSINSNLETQVANYEKADEEKESAIVGLKQINSNTESLLSKQKKKTTFWKATATVITAVGTYFIITK